MVCVVSTGVCWYQDGQTFHRDTYTRTGYVAGALSAYAGAVWCPVLP